VLDGPAAVRPETDRRQAGGDGDGDGDGEARGPDGTE
jgi:hypothetical protein